MNAPAQAPSFQLNPEHAREGSGGGAGRIDTSGAYKGVITKAKFVVATTGSTGIEIDFESSAGATARYITLYTHNNKGEFIYGYKRLMALMTCLKLKTITPAAAVIPEYNFDTHKEEQVQATIYPELMNAPIGMVLQKEFYVKKDGTPGEKMNLYAPFSAETEQVAKEILDQESAQQLEKIIATLKDKPAPAQQAPAYQQPPAVGYDPLNQDIPF